MSTPLDSILSGRSEAMPATEIKTTEQAPAIESQETGTQEQATEGQQQEGEGGAVRTVPHEALHAEKQKVKRYTEEVTNLRQENAHVRQELTRIAQLLEQNKPKPEAPDWWANPDEAFNQQLQRNVHPVLQQHAQQVQATRELVSRRFAEQTHGKEALGAAYAELEQRLQTDPSARTTYQQIMSSDDPWDALGQWHKREKFLAEAGNDPDAYKAKLKAELLAELQPGDGQQRQQQKPAPVLPSNLAGARNVGNRSGPAWGGPQPIGSIFDMKRKPSG